MGEPWRPGLPSEPCVCDIRSPSFGEAHSARVTTEVGPEMRRKVFLCVMSRTVGWNDSRGHYQEAGTKSVSFWLLASECEWCPVQVPEGVPDA